MRNGSLFAKLCSGPCVRVVVFKSLLPQLSTHGSNLYLLKNGDRLRVEGKLSSYRGSYEIAVENAAVGG
jgi:DNA/RNA endonuclease YhcR with UshA esterase domain